MSRSKTAFEGVTYKYFVDPAGDHNIHAIHPNEDGAIGALIWDNEGAIHVGVNEEHQRKGVATGMYHAAVQKAGELGIPAPNLMKSSYGNKGYKWARTLGLPKDFGKK